MHKIPTSEVSKSWSKYSAKERLLTKDFGFGSVLTGIHHFGPKKWITAPDGKNPVCMLMYYCIFGTPKSHSLIIAFSGSLCYFVCLFVFSKRIASCTAITGLFVSVSSCEQYKKTTEIPTHSKSGD